MPVVTVEIKLCGICDESSWLKLALASSLVTSVTSLFAKFIVDGVGGACGTPKSVKVEVGQIVGKLG